MGSVGPGLGSGHLAGGKGQEGGGGGQGTPPLSLINTQVYRRSANKATITDSVLLFIGR